MLFEDGSEYYSSVKAPEISGKDSLSFSAVHTIPPKSFPSFITTLPSSTSYSYPYYLTFAPTLG
jgi:hypothetical protein